MDDVHRYFLDTTGASEILAHGVSSVILVYNVAFGYQRSDPRLLYPRDRRLGMVEGKMEH